MFPVEEPQALGEPQLNQYGLMRSLLREAIFSTLDFYPQPGAPNVSDRENQVLIPEAGNALSFDGIADRVDCGNPASLQITGATIVGCWVKTNTNDHVMMSKSTAAGNQVAWQLRFASGGGEIKVNLSADGSTTKEVTVAGAAYQNDTWHQIIFVYDPLVSIKVFVDGVLEETDTTSIPASIFDSSANVIIGARDAGVVANFDGELAHAFIYAPSSIPSDIADDIAWTYSQRKLPHQRLNSSLQAADCKGYWPCDHAYNDTSTTIVPELSEFNNHATNVNAGASPVTGEPDIPQLTATGFTQKKRFNGINHRADATLTFPAGSFTVACIATLETLGALEAAVGVDSTNTNNPLFRIQKDASDRLEFVVANTLDANFRSQTAVSAVSQHELVRLVGVYDDSDKSLTLYVNGIGQTPDTLTGTRAVASGTFYIGVLKFTHAYSNYWPGIIDEIVLWDVALNASQVSEWDNSGFPLDVASHSVTPIHYWRNGWLLAGDWEDRVGTAHAVETGLGEVIILSARPDNPDRDALGGHVHQQRPIGFAGANASGLVVALGPELADAKIQDVSNWEDTDAEVTVSEGQIVFSGTTALMGAYYNDGNINIESGAYYAIELDITSYTAGTIQLIIYDETSTFVASGISSAGRHTAIITPTTGGGSFTKCIGVQGQIGTTGTVSGMSVRKLVVSDIFDGGGAICGWINAASDGANDLGRIVDKTGSSNTSGFRVSVRSETGGVSVKMSFGHERAGSAGVWQTIAADVDLGTPTFFAWVYNRDDVANEPTLYLGADGTFTTLTVGSGLSSVSVPTSTANSDAANILYIGNRSNEARTFDGSIYEIAAYDRILTADEVESFYNITKFMFE